MFWGGKGARLGGAWGGFPAGQRETIAGAGDPKATEKVPCQASDPKLPGARFPPAAWQSVYLPL